MKESGYFHIATGLWPAYRGLKPTWTSTVRRVRWGLWPAYRGLKLPFKAVIGQLTFVYDPLIGDWNIQSVSLSPTEALGLWPAYRGLKLFVNIEVCFGFFSLWPAYRGLKQGQGKLTVITTIVYDPLIGDWNNCRLRKYAGHNGVYDPLIGDWNTAA